MKLPNAPLLEVVFELRWALEGPADIAVQLRHDPAYPLLAFEFTEKAKAQGFIVRREIAPSPPGPLGHSVHYRFFQDENSPFPIWQIGPGIFAYNESTSYEWSEYKKSLRTALQALLASYPKSKALKMRPVYLELRYIDSFGPELLGHADLSRFLSNDTNFVIKPNDFLKSSVFTDPIEGRMILSRRLKRDKQSSFRIEVGTGQANKRPAVLVVSKVIKESEDINLGSNSRSIIANVTRWADAAHELTHKFFWDFVSDALMKTFKE